VNDRLAMEFGLARLAFYYLLMAGLMVGIVLYYRDRNSETIITISTIYMGKRLLSLISRGPIAK